MKNGAVFFSAFVFIFSQISSGQTTFAIQKGDDIHIVNEPAIQFTEDANDGTSQRLVVANYKC